MQSNQPTLNRVYKTISGITSGKSLTQAAKEAHTTPRTFNRVNKQYGLIIETKPERGNRKSFVTNKVIIIDDKGNVHGRVHGKGSPIILDAQSAKAYKEYIAIIKGSTTLQGADYDLKRLKGLTLYDIKGKKYKPTLNVDILIPTMDSNDITSDDLFHSEKRK